MKKYREITLKISVIVILLVLFVFYNLHLNQSRISSFTLLSDNLNRYTYEIEHVWKDTDYIFLEGWFLELKNYRNEEIETLDNKELIVLLNDTEEKAVESDEGILFQNAIPAATELKKRNDVDDYFSCEYDYSESGFVAKIKLDKIDLDNKVYQVIFKQDKNEKPGIATNMYLRNGKIEYNNMPENIQKALVGTNLEDVVKNGIYHGGSDNHMYIFQYENKLYWIADPEYPFNDDNTLIQYLVDTTQYSKLPTSRTDLNIYWDSIGESFEKYEVTDQINSGDYRVAIRDIPTDYSVVSIHTGYYVDGNWVWMISFRPLHRLSDNKK